MASDYTLDFTTGYAADSSNECKWWGGHKRRERGRLYADKLRKQWGLGYGDNELEELPYNLLRDSSSEYFIPCEDVEEIYHQAKEQYDNAVDRFNSCGDFSKKCKCRGVIDKAKWMKIYQWADGARNSQSDILDYDRCDEEEAQDAIDAVLDKAQSLLEEREGVGLPNTTMLGLIGAGTLGLIFIMLKATK